MSSLQLHVRSKPVQQSSSITRHITEAHKNTKEYKKWIEPIENKRKDTLWRLGS